MCHRGLVETSQLYTNRYHVVMQKKSQRTRYISTLVDLNLHKSGPEGNSNTSRSIRNSCTMEATARNIFFSSRYVAPQLRQHCCILRTRFKATSEVNFIEKLVTFVVSNTYFKYFFRKLILSAVLLLDAKTASQQTIPATFSLENKHSRDNTRETLTYLSGRVRNDKHQDA